MALSHYLQPKSIITPLVSRDKASAIRELVHRLAEENKLADEERLYELVMEREVTTSTFLPMGIAIPHARTDMVDEIVMVMGTAPEGIADEGEGISTESPEPIRVHLFFLFLSPTKEKEFGKHLKLLARLAAVFDELEFAVELSKIDDPDEIFARIQHREREIDER